MNTEILKGKWNLLKGRIQEKWGELTNDEIDQIQGKKDVLAGKLEVKYGMTRQQAEQEINNFLKEIEV